MNGATIERILKAAVAGEFGLDFATVRGLCFDLRADHWNWLAASALQDLLDERGHWLADVVRMDLEQTAYLRG